MAESCHRVQEKDKMDPWRWSSARTGLIAWEDAILCIGRAVQADLAVTCPTRGGPRGEIMRRNMNKGAVEFFSKGKCRRCEPRRRGEGRREEPSANRIERIGVETGHGSLYECLGLEQSGTDQRPRWQPATRALLQGVAYARNLLGERSLYLSSSWVITRGTLPILLDLRQRRAEDRVEFAPTLRHVF